MQKGKVLFVLSGVWSLGKGKGMPSVHRILAAADQKFGCIIFTPDSHIANSDYPNSRLVRLWWPKLNTGSRYLDFLAGRFFYVLACLQVLCLGLRWAGGCRLIYANTAVPAVFLLGAIFHLPTLHRAYGTFIKVGAGFFYNLAKYEEAFLFFFPAAAYLITNDGTRGDEVAQYFGARKDRVYFWKNGVDVKKNNLNFDWRANLGLPDNSILYGIACRLVSWKRVDRCIAAFKRSANGEARLLIAGGGSELSNLKQKAEGDDRIIFLGELTSEQATTFIKALDVYITLYDVSNVGNPLLEALACGLPIITCNTGDTASVINGDNGLIINASCEEMLIQEVSIAIDHLAVDSMERQRLSNGALEYAQKNLISWDERISHEIKLLEDLMKGEKRSKC